MGDEGRAHPAGGAPLPLNQRLKRTSADVRWQVGPKDMAQGTCRMVRRLDGSKEDASLPPTLDNGMGAGDVLAGW